MRSIVLMVVTSVVLALGASPAAAISVTWGGDTTLGSSYGMPPDRGWPQLAAVAADVLRRADLAALNCEGTFAPGGASKCAGHGEELLRLPGARGERDDAAPRGVDVVNLANNHAFDYGPLGTAAPAVR